MHKFFNSKIAAVLVIILYCIVFYSIQRNAPLQWDDFDFMTTNLQNSDGTWEKGSQVISSPSEMLTAYEAHRDTKNGRTSDLFVILSLNILGKSGFAVLNTMMGLLFILLYTKYFFKELKAVHVLMAIVAALAIISNIPRVVFWASGACNYLWGAVALIVFLFSYKKIQESEVHGTNKLSLFLCCLLAFVASTIHEHLGFSILGMISLHIVVDTLRNKKLPESKYFLVALSALSGFAVTALCLGIWSRMGRELGGFNLFSIVRHATIPVFCIILYVLRFRKSFFTSNIFYFTLSALLFYLCINQGNSRASIYLSLGSFMLVLQIIESRNKKYDNILLVISVLISSVFAVSVYKNYAHCNRIIAYILSLPPHQSIIVVDTTSNPEVSTTHVVNEAVVQASGNKLAATVWQRDNFVVIFNALVPNREVYAAFEGTDEQRCNVIRNDGKCIVRLPLGVCPSAESQIELKNDVTGKTIIAQSYTSRQSPLFTLLNKYRTSAEQVINFARDYDGKFFYLIFTSSACTGYEVSIPCLTEQKEAIELRLTL